MVHSCPVLRRSQWTISFATFVFPLLNCSLLISAWDLGHFLSFLSNSFLSSSLQHYDFQDKVDSKTTKPCYHAGLAGVFTLLLSEGPATDNPPPPMSLNNDLVRKRSLRRPLFFHRSRVVACKISDWCGRALSQRLRADRCRENVEPVCSHSEHLQLIPARIR